MNPPIEHSALSIAVIGIINHDTIQMANGEELQDLGGILYNVAVLANVADAGTTIYPVSRIGRDCWDRMLHLLRPYPNVDTRGIVIAPEGTSRNSIRYDASMEKVERLTNHIAPIPFTQVEPFVGYDALLINFIIGDDVSLDTLRAVRARSTGLLYLDVHNLCLGIDADGYRFHHRPDDWREWLSVVDIVQMNEVEACLLAGRPIHTDDEFAGIGREVLAAGPAIVIVTRGRQGSVTVSRRAGADTVFVCPPEPVDRVVDTTGCGDAFAAGFLTEYLKMNDPVAASRLANWTAGVNCTLAGLKEVGRFRNHR
ncbi:MAG: carbohydrate kinase family protein [Candidatus Latescibacteria bacterium]|nr:carbohydrate kinase family protein [Candidatus Latescibacterota bacterium]